MKNSALRVSATKWKNGLSASRPNTISPASASAAGDERLTTSASPRPRSPPPRKRRRHDEQRRDREVLEQEHREARAADRRAEPLALDQHRDDDRRRGDAERGGDDQRGGRREAERRPRSRSAPRMVTDDLAEPEPEHQPPHAPDALERQFEAHGEQEHDDAEGGDPVDRLDIADGEGAEPRRLAGRARRGRRARAPRPRAGSRAPD